MHFLDYKFKDFVQNTATQSQTTPSGAVVIDLTLTRTGPVRAAGQEAAFPFQLLMEVNGTTMKTDIIDVFRFDKDGKIVQMRAFWEPDNRIPATE